MEFAVRAPQTRSGAHRRRVAADSALQKCTRARRRNCSHTLGAATMRAHAQRPNGKRPLANGQWPVQRSAASGHKRQMKIQLALDKLRPIGHNFGRPARAATSNNNIRREQQQQTGEEERARKQQRPLTKSPQPHTVPRWPPAAPCATGRAPIN